MTTYKMVTAELTTEEFIHHLLQHGRKLQGHDPQLWQEIRELHEDSRNWNHESTLTLRGVRSLAASCILHGASVDTVMDLLGMVPR